MRSSVLLIACFFGLFLTFSSAATIVAQGLITYNNQALTSNGDGNQVTLSSIGVCDVRQLWVLDSDGFIYRKDNATLVLDNQNAIVSNGNPVIMWYKKTPYAANQQWYQNSTGIFTQQSPYYSLRKSSTTQNILISNNPGVQYFQFTQPPSNCPETCVSHGDPHFTSWTGQHFDFQSANTVLLANFSGNRVYTVQYPCNTGVTCNEGFVVHPTGTNETMQITYQQVWHNRTMTYLPLGTTVYSAFITVNKISNTSYQIFIPNATISFAVYYNWVAVYCDVSVTLTGLSTPAPSLCIGPNPPVSPAHAFGSQFIVQNQSSTDYQYTRTPFSYNPNYNPNYGPYTTNDPNLVQMAQQVCGQLTSPTGPFAACQQYLDPTYFYGTCINDSYVMGSTAFAPGSIDAYARLCNEAAQRNGTTIVFPTSASGTVVVVPTYTVRVSVQYNFTIVAKDYTGKNRSVGGDTFTVLVTAGPTTLQFTIVDNGDGTYSVNTTAYQEGTYTISVRFGNSNGSDVSGSPFNVSVTAATSASTSGLVLGPVSPNTNNSFTIQARTSSGNSRTMGGDQFAVSFSSSSVTLTAIIDNGDGTYTIVYMASTPGVYQIYVSYMGTPISCSPYTVIVKSM